MSAKGSELKRVRQANKARLRNKSYLSKFNTVSKRVLATTKKEDGINELIKVCKILQEKSIFRNF